MVALVTTFSKMTASHGCVHIGKRPESDLGVLWGMQGNETRTALPGIKERL
jgi:hypothetical protein